MRAVIQRVSQASVAVAGEEIVAIQRGLLILLGIENGDQDKDRDWLAAKIARLRIFDDESGQMNLSLIDTGGQALVVSQFTLHASTKKGKRPSFTRAARPEIAEPAYLNFCERLAAEIGQNIPRGHFGAEMRVSLVNEGPVTIMIDSRDRQ